MVCDVPEDREDARALTHVVSPDIGKLITFSACTAYYGLFFAIALRKFYILKLKLIFPSPTAVAYTIRSLHAGGAEAEASGRRKAKTALDLKPEAIRLTSPNGKETKEYRFKAENVIENRQISDAWFDGPGMVSKLWMAADEQGVYRGFYEWDGAARAESYARSLWRVLALVSERA